MNSPSNGAEDDAGAPLLEHLVELRQRLLRAIAGVLVITLLLLPFGNVLYGWLALPVLQALGPGGQMIATDPIAPFLTPLKLSFFTALIVAMPWVLYQAWSFVAPGLYRNEQRLAMPLLISATLLFYLGCTFAYTFVLPVVFAFTVSVSPEGVAVMTDITSYLDFVVVIFLAFGAAFEVPVATIIIVALGWASIEQLRAARPYVIVGAFVVAAILTPPDVFSQLLLAIPMTLLYEIGILASAWLIKPRLDNDSAT